MSQQVPGQTKASMRQAKQIEARLLEAESPELALFLRLVLQPHFLG